MKWHAWLVAVLLAGCNEAPVRTVTSAGAMLGRLSSLNLVTDPLFSQTGSIGFWIVDVTGGQTAAALFTYYDLPTPSATRGVRICGGRPQLATTFPAGRGVLEVEVWAYLEGATQREDWQDIAVQVGDPPSQPGARVYAIPPGNQAVRMGHVAWMPFRGRVYRQLSSLSVLSITALVGGKCLYVAGPLVVAEQPQPTFSTGRPHDPGEAVESSWSAEQVNVLEQMLAKQRRQL